MKVKLAFFKKNGPIVFFFIQVKKKKVIYQESIAVMKEYSLQRNYGTKYTAHLM